MLRRKIQTEIADYLDNGSEKILILDGARQIGKSFIIRHEGQKRFNSIYAVSNSLCLGKLGAFRGWLERTQPVDAAARLS